MDDPAKEVSIDEFKKLEIRVGVVSEVSRVPRTEKLYKVIVDFGPAGKRQTVTSLVGYYTVDELMGKRVAFLLNLRPAKFAGEKSEGMLLAASDGPKLSLLTIDREVPNGSRVS
jgi:methionyl-tRNA synthetase